MRVTEQRVLFDDTANNSLNMISVGIQLLTPMERVLFLHNARIISSIDMASFFTQLRLSADVADYWMYDGGPHDKLCNRRMVQRNSESPAVTQAFILHVLEGVCDADWLHQGHSPWPLITVGYIIPHGWALIVVYVSLVLL
ncbi:hypothetical protein COEREDRAFT_12222 [Coemansia reversa NRRL 1564]|uniref:Uncharacterized protein n=1 Tax=Coemansia reversa (strain ATCC 12441 / NRRL 1564) TaxID=763665 RepID=A0A2G5B174_COERN|nr:hypothetical protein COEREDRAFT_12222 [Coemansia reversa NRRL 1564]|eukprot:PIA12763.1 hypothetical protein COEREDRAFT_12222 [Coemansia reversa NRRL 1564]